MKVKIFLAVLLAAFTAACCAGIVLLCRTGAEPSPLPNDEFGGSRVEIKGDAPPYGEPAYNPTLPDDFTDDTDDTDDFTDVDEPPEPEEPDVPATPSDNPVPPLENDEPAEEIHTHTAVFCAAVEATCTEAGKLEYWFCTECGRCFSDEDLTDEIEESYLIIAPNGHTPVIDEAIPATCTGTGLSEGSHCRDCGEVFVAQTVIDATGHNYVDGICKNCGDWEVSTGLAFTETDGGNAYILSGLGDCEANNVRIPDTYNGKPVVGIEDWALQFEEMTGIYVPASITYIGEYAFYYCEKLVRVHLEDGVEEIALSAFDNCTSLTSVRLSDTLKTIGESAFTDCASLEEIFIPSSVEAIGIGAFESCTKLTDIRLSDNLKTLEMQIFENCSSLKEIIIPASVETIELRAFSDCTALETVIFLGTVPNIAHDAFSNCPYTPQNYRFASEPKNWR